MFYCGRDELDSRGSNMRQKQLLAFDDSNFAIQSSLFFLLLLFSVVYRFCFIYLFDLCKQRAE